VPYLFTNCVEMPIYIYVFFLEATLFWDFTPNKLID
jgi:hypothetical protein